MVKFLKHAGEWILGKADEINKLDGIIKAAIHQQAKRTFYIGDAVGIVVTVVIVKIIG
ncbi:putative membrane protein [Propionispora sp. 2/2-37]|uniref:hypothetical protein n=1 Tax=Propionispora sp. 2/2-37 TaxID=1677858 RepID=UPI0006C5A685|nr:hypothetical protein [Propionispora sp. 2/2-37]CUH97355.1 putative membrane protein [Propionispora sp. 2/2-37]